MVQMITIGKKFKFEAAHYLPEHPGKCRFAHGHTYSMVVELDGPVHTKTRMVMDFYDLAKIVNPIVEMLDHHNLNEVLEGKVGRTTVEELCIWVAERLSCDIPAPYTITVEIQEGEGGWARFVTDGEL